MAEIVGAFLLRSEAVDEPAEGVPECLYRSQGTNTHQRLQLGSKGPARVILHGKKRECALVLLSTDRKSAGG